MLIRRVNLALADSTESRICRRADGTLGIVVDAVEAAFVERVVAEEVHSRQVECPATRLATAGLEGDGLAGEVVEFLLLGGCFGFVARYESAVLEGISIGL